MQTFELLDRFELLYPTKSKLSDLRRSYIDKDVSSIFRLTRAEEELRKSVMEKTSIVFLELSIITILKNCVKQ